MTNKSVIQTDNAPDAIGTYSQAVKAGDTIYLSGQIPLDPASMELVPGGIEAQIQRVFNNLRAVCEASGGSIQGPGGDGRRHGAQITVSSRKTRCNPGSKE